MPHVLFVEMSTTGAGEACVAYAVGQGYHVTLLAADPARYTGQADTTTVHIERCDTNDHDALLRAVTRVDQRRRVDGVTTTQDLYVPHAALVAATLGLPGMSFEAAAGVRNKYRMRRTLARSCPELNPPFRLVLGKREASRTAARWGYPLVAKPQNANDSCYVQRITSDAELAAYARAAESWGCDGPDRWIAPGILLEGYIDGGDYSVETVQYPGGQIQLLAVSARELLGLENGNFAEAGDLLPVRGAVADMLFHAVARALPALGVDCGVIHTECRAAGDHVKIVEVNPRLAGDMLGSHMIEIAYGVSAIPHVVETALANVLPWQPTRDAGAGGYSVSMSRTGIFRGIENLADLRAVPGVACVRLAAEIGTLCHWPPRSNLDFVARVITGADTPEKALALARRVALDAKVVVGDP